MHALTEPATTEPGTPDTAKPGRMMIPVADLTAHHLLTELLESFLQFRGQAAGGWLRSVVLFVSEDRLRDVAGLVVPRAGKLWVTGEAGEPYRLLDANGAAVVPAGVFFRDLHSADPSGQASARPCGFADLHWSVQVIPSPDPGWPTVGLTAEPEL